VGGSLAWAARPTKPAPSLQEEFTSAYDQKPKDDPQLINALFGQVQVTRSAWNKSLKTRAR